MPTGALVLDLALDRCLMDLAFVQAGPQTARAGPTLALRLGAEAFRQAGDFARYRLCATSIDGRVLEALVRQRPPALAKFTADFVALHEHAHLALDATLDWAMGQRDVVELARGQYLAQLRLQRQTPSATPASFVHHVGTPIEALEPGVVEDGLDLALAAVEARPTIITEATCDWIATLGVLAQTSGVNFMADEPLATGRGTRRESGDAIYLSVRLGRLLGFLSLLRQAAVEMAHGAGGSPDRSSQIEADARLNIVTNLVSGLQPALGEVGFSEGTGFPATATLDRVNAAFDASLAQDIRQFHDRVFTLLDHIEPLRDPDHVDRLFRQRFSKSAASASIEDLLAGDELLAQLPV